MKNKIVLALSLSFLLLAGCGVNQTVSHTKNTNGIVANAQTSYSGRLWYVEGKFEYIQTWPKNDDKLAKNRWYEVRDVETGVHYYLNEIDTYYSDGYCLTPVYESDGTVRVTN